MKKKLALFLAVVLAVSSFGGYIPAKAADERIVMEPSEVKGNRQVASAVEETTYDGVDVLKITPDGETESAMLLDNYDILDLTVSQEENKYVAVDYYYEAEADGSWTGWNINSNTITDKAMSDAKSEELGTTIEDFDATVLGVSYMAKLTDAIGSYKVSQDITGVSQGDTYVFSFDYYMPVGGRNTYGIRTTNSAGTTKLYMANIDTQNSDVDGYGHVMMTYTVEDSDVTKLTPFVKHDSVESSDNIGYYWNFSFTKVARNEHKVNVMSNLLTNSDFATENGSWIGWKFEWSTSVADKTTSDTMTEKYGYEIVPFDEELLGRAADYHVAKVINNYTGTSTTSRTKLNQKLVPEAGATYRFSCDYYLPAGVRGKLNINSSSDIASSNNSSSEAIWVAPCQAGGTEASRGKMVVEYTAKEDDTYIQPRFYVDMNSKATGYFWNLRVIKVGDTDADKYGTGENLLTNADFATDDDKVPENMVLRMLNPNEPEAGTPSTNSIVTNQWARAIFDYSDFFATYGAKGSYPGIYKQMHFFPWGQTDDSKGTTAEGTMYINNMSFYKEYPGLPSVTGISFIADEIPGVCGGRVRIPTVTVEGENYPITAYDLELSGHSSADTKISDGYLYIGAGETATTITITAKSVVDTAVTATCTVNVKDVIERTSFDENNITTRFGVVSDVHVSGSWNQERSVAKFAHTIEALQKTAAEDNASLDAILVNGDFVDAVASTDNVDKDTTTYGSKAVQNFREVNYVAQGLWGAPIEGTTSLSDTTTGYGAGVDDGVKFFYSLGNHDESGKGETSYDTTTYDKVYSAEYFAAIICGWQYDISKDRENYATAAWDESYVDYINDLIDYNTNTETTVTEDDFYTKYGVTLESADAKFDKYYGFDTNYSNEDGLLYGNRHMIINNGSEDTDAIHFVALELSLSDASLNFLDEICTQSVTENPNKPIFVLTHYKVSEDMPGYVEVQNRVREMMAKYPQIIVWGGHSHTYLQSDLAIDSDEGFIQVDSGVSAYAAQQYLTFEASQGDSATGSLYADNASNKENHAYNMGCYVEVDANFNVRINRIDLYRSFSADYAEDTGLYSHEIFTNYANKAEAEPVDKAVFVRSAWDITDIGLEGIHLADYTNERIAKTEKPVLTDTSTISVERSGDTLTANLTLDATDDGMVYMYVVELWNATDNSVLARHYYTNKFYNYPDVSQIPAIEVEAVFDGIDVGTTYEVKAYPVDDFKVAGEAISETIHKVKYVYVSDISKYRGDDKSYPELAGYVFAGWYHGTADVVPTTDKTLTAVETTTTSGGAWAKYVPAEALSVKAQVTDLIVNNPTSTKLRLVSTVDSLRYSEVGFKIKYNQGNKEYTYDTKTVYTEIKAIDAADIQFTYQPTEFSAVSTYFVAYTVTGIGAELFDNYEFAVIPYWVTLDGTTVTGASRERLLVTDQLAANADGCDFTVENDTYTYMTDASNDNTASYQYIQGASDTVYMEGTYTKSDSQFGISIRNGGEERQIFFATDGVKVVNSDMNVSGLVEGAVVTIGNASAINTMLSATAGTQAKIAWEIKDNVLYCSIDGVAVYEVPMTNLCADWKDGRYYQVGLAGYNTAAIETTIVFVLEELQFGK